MPASGRNIIENPSATKYDAGLDSERRERVEELYRFRLGSHPSTRTAMAMMPSLSRRVRVCVYECGAAPPAQ